MGAFDGAPTESERADIDRLRRKCSSALLFLMLPEARVAATQIKERQSGHVSDEVLEAQVAGVDARVPWAAVLAYVASTSVLLLAIGRSYVAIARSFFPSEAEWQAARAIVERNVPNLPTGISTASIWRSVVLWVTLLVVMFLAWYFAQVPSAR